MNFIKVLEADIEQTSLQLLRMTHELNGLDDFIKRTMDNREFKETFDTMHKEHKHIELQLKAALVAYKSYKDVMREPVDINFMRVLKELSNTK